MFALFPLFVFFVLSLRAEILRCLKSLASAVSLKAVNQANLASVLVRWVNSLPGNNKEKGTACNIERSQLEQIGLAVCYPQCGEGLFWVITAQQDSTAWWTAGSPVNGRSHTR